MRGSSDVMTRQGISDLHLGERVPAVTEATGVRGKRAWKGKQDLEELDQYWAASGTSIAEALSGTV